MAHSTYSMSGTVQCSCRASDFHSICAYLPSNPIAINSTTPGTYANRLRLVKLASSSEGSVASTSSVLTASPRNLGQQPSHGQQHQNAGHNRGPPIKAYPPQAFTTRWSAIVIARGHRSLLNSPVPTAKALCRFLPAPRAFGQGIHSA